jgi:hypothetical protein
MVGIRRTAAVSTQKNPSLIGSDFIDVQSQLTSRGVDILSKGQGHFFKILGWAFGQEQAFEDYLFVVFLNNKLVGLLLLFSSFVMAFSDTTSSSLTFKLALFLVVLMLLYRFLRGYQVFSKQSKVGLFTLFLAFLALELIPSAVLIKFLTKSVGLYLTALQ